MRCLIVPSFKVSCVILRTCNVRLVSPTSGKLILHRSKLAPRTKSSSSGFAVIALIPPRLTSVNVSSSNLSASGFASSVIGMMQGTGLTIGVARRKNSLRCRRINFCGNAILMALPSFKETKDIWALTHLILMPSSLVKVTW